MLDVLKAMASKQSSSNALTTEDWLPLTIERRPYSYYIQVLPTTQCAYDIDVNISVSKRLQIH